MGRAARRGGKEKRADRGSRRSLHSDTPDLTLKGTGERQTRRLASTIASWSKEECQFAESPLRGGERHGTEIRETESRNS